MRQVGKVMCGVGLILTVPLTLATGARAMDLSDMSTPRCEVSGLAVSPPDRWLSVPMQGLPEQMAACQITRIGDDELPVGLIRVLSVRTGPDMPADEARERVIGFESLIWQEIGYEITERLWVREDVPIDDIGEGGFSGGSAVGLAAVIEGTQLPQEIHVLFFSRLADDTHYAVSLLTPAGPDASTVYRHNLEDYSRVLNSFMLTGDDRVSETRFDFTHPAAHRLCDKRKSA